MSHEDDVIIKLQEKVIEELQLELDELKKSTTYDELLKIRGDMADLKEENEALKKKAMIIKVGNIRIPDFDPKASRGMKFDMNDPESAYMYGWEAAILECGEILSKP